MTALLEALKGRPWIPAALWLAFLAPFFFLTYNFANDVTARRENVPVIVFDWERLMPFLGWTILPYWTSDLLYGLSLALCRTRAELNRHAGRLVAIQIISVGCFLAFPLQCTLTRPAVSGWQALLFDSLAGFDKPFNQAPSLHVSLAVILWTEYRKHCSGLVRAAVAAWFVLIGLSAWTTYQHHFIDLPTGFWAGVLVTAALPERAYPQSRRVKLMAFYLAGAVAFTVSAFWLQGVAWILLWPAFALSLVAAAYWTGDPAWLGKRGGRMPFWMLPYAAAAWLNSRIWTRGESPHNQVADGVWVGRSPSRAERARFHAVVDLTAELPVKSDACVPVLDLTAPHRSQLDAAVEAIERLRRGNRPLLVCCALGYSRSAMAAAAWLVATGRAVSVDDAVARVQAARPQVVIRATPSLTEWAKTRNGSQV